MGKIVKDRFALVTNGAWIGIEGEEEEEEN